VNDELKTTWKEVVVAYCKTTAQNLLGEIKENHEKHYIRITDLQAYN
jgi:preprotein translocase subunit Sec63